MPHRPRRCHPPRRPRASARQGPPGGGIDVVEITLHTPAGLDAIRTLAASLPDLQVGAGSVLVADQVDQVADAGAQFVVSPGLSVDVLARSEDHGIPALPGVPTASELMTAVSLGLAEVKFFPPACSAARALTAPFTAPFTAMAFMPSGGVTARSRAAVESARQSAGAATAGVTDEAFTLTVRKAGSLPGG